MCGAFLLFLIVVILVLLFAITTDAMFSVRVGRHPETRFTVLHGLVLRCQVNALALVALSAVLAALGEVARAGRELGLDGGVGGNPIGEGILTILDDTVHVLVSYVVTLSPFGSRTPC